VEVFLIDDSDFLLVAKLIQWWGSCGEAHHVRIRTWRSRAKWLIKFNVCLSKYNITPNTLFSRCSAVAWMARASHEHSSVTINLLSHESVSPAVPDRHTPTAHVTALVQGSLSSSAPCSPPTGPGTAAAYNNTVLPPSPSLFIIIITTSSGGAFVSNTPPFNSNYNHRPLHVFYTFRVVESLPAPNLRSCLRST
jgi:hypothetical protein